jgi:hypothetical protein
VDQHREEVAPLSTKVTIAHGIDPFDFHLYEESGDPGHLHLEVVNGDTTTIHRIPTGVLVGISRRMASVDLQVSKCARRTDAEIREEAEGEVRARLGTEDKLTQLFGAITYGDHNDPFEEQVSRGVWAMTRQRDRCSEIVSLAEKVEQGLA